jgi:hypothetical protein
MTEADSSARAAVLKWLASQGYPLEMASAEHFRRAGFSVAQSQYYSDPEKGVAREIDVVASIYEIGEISDIQLSVVAECKKSPDKPWVIFTSPHTINERGALYLRTTSEGGQAFLRAAGREASARALEVFRLPKRLGHGVTQAFSSGKDVPFEAVMEAAKASTHQVTAFKADWDRLDANALIVLPLVITEAPLYESYLDEAGEIVLEEVDRALLTWRHPGVGQRFMLVDVIRSSTVPAFAQAAKLAVDTFKTLEFALKASRNSWNIRHGRTQTDAP